MYFSKQDHWSARPFLTLLLLLTAGISATAVASSQYFQQEVNYKINVTLDDVNHFLRGEEALTYINRSDSTLNVLFIHLWPNAYRDAETPLGKEMRMEENDLLLKAKKKDRGFIDSLDFRSGGTTLSWTMKEDTPDVAILRLSKPLAPGDSVTIETPFRVKIPAAKISRFGHEKQAYYITQWYPKPAVFDRYGWHPMSYQDQGEYYGEFGTYDVTITLPENYVTGATGRLVDGEKEQAWLTQRERETRAAERFNADSLAFPATSPTTKTLHYRQDRIHDFAWFADKRWKVLSEEVFLPESGRTVKLWSFFLNSQAELWKKSTEYIRQALLSYSSWLGEYPYDHMTAVQCENSRGNDMEYPMITVIGDQSDSINLEVTIAHEVGHNWFYGILGTNERNYAWMDEGVNKFYEMRYLYTKYPDQHIDQKSGRNLTRLLLDRIGSRFDAYNKYVSGARKNTDQPSALPSEQYTAVNYGDDVYNKTALGFEHLKSYLGDTLFDRAMHSYYNEWKFRHPYPDDMQHSLEKTTGKNLDWLFDDWLQTTKKVDYKIAGIETRKDSFEIKLRNTAQIATPVAIGTKDDKGNYHTNWLEGFNKDTVLRIAGSPSFPRPVDPENAMPEINRKNNYVRASGILRRTERLNIGFGTGLENPERTQLYALPAIGWNAYNEFMAGGVLHNVGLPCKKLEFAVMPLYAFGTKDLAGGGNVTYRIYPLNSFIREIALRAGISRYGYVDDYYKNETTGFTYSEILHFLKSENSISIAISNPNPRNKIDRRVILRHLYIEKEIPYGYEYNEAKRSNIYFDLTFLRTNNHLWNRNNQEFKIQINKNFQRITYSSNFRLPYQNPRKGFEIGIFSGLVNIKSSNTLPDSYDFYLSGRNGQGDYLFDEVFIGRTESSGLLAQQFTTSDGGFSSPTSYFRKANKWMVALHAKTEIPGILPVLLYANAATFNDADKGFDEAQTVSMEGGIEIRLIPDIFTVYIPIVYSKDIKYALDQQDFSFGEQIRFEFHLKQLNPLDALKKF